MFRPNLVNSLPGEYVGVFGMLAAVSAVWVGYISAKKIPKLLFALNGYSTRVKHFWNRSRADDPPWLQHRITMYLGGGAVAFIWAKVIEILSMSIAHILIAVKTLTVGS